MENNSETNTINPNYQGIITGSAISGAIAGAFVTLGEYLSNTTTKPTMETAKEGAFKKPSDLLLKTDAFQEMYPDYIGSVLDKETGQLLLGADNMGSAILTDSMDDVFTAVLDSARPTLLNSLSSFKEFSEWGSNFFTSEHGTIMKPISTLIPGMNGMATAVHDPFAHIAATQIIKPATNFATNQLTNIIPSQLAEGASNIFIKLPLTLALNQGTILPAIALHHCSFAPSACSGIALNHFNKK